MEFPSLPLLDFPQDHFQTSPYCLHLSLCSLLSSPISILSQLQSLLIRPYFSPSPLPSPRETFQHLSTPPQVLGVPFQWHLRSYHRQKSQLGNWYWCEVYTTVSEQYTLHIQENGYGKEVISTREKKKDNFYLS